MSDRHSDAPEVESASEAKGKGEAVVSRRLPFATLRPERRWTWAWLAPLAALLLVSYLGYRAYVDRGLPIEISFVDGFGLKEGDEVRYRGIVVGHVRGVALGERGAGVAVEVTLERNAAWLARAGTRFWIVRPRVGLQAIEGLDTVLGGRYIAVEPGESLEREQREFQGLSEAPLLQDGDASDLEIVLLAPTRGSVSPGAPVLYRDLPVGIVLSVGLTSDGTGVESRLHIEGEYRQLIREGTRFWDSGGFDARIGLQGVTLQARSLESVLLGSVTLATPVLEQAGEVVHTGHRFALAAKPEEAWLEWQPIIAVGSSLLPRGAILPTPLRATLGWEQGWLIDTERTRQGWVLPTDRGLLGPSQLLVVGERERQGEAELEVGGQAVSLAGNGRTIGSGGLAVLAAAVGERAWPATRIRSAVDPEDCIIVGDSHAEPLALAADKLQRSAGGWAVDAAVPVDETWHGAAVLARADGLLVGLLLV
ncbi:MAG: MlaD family protein, partial [Phycisphaerales bacterium JB038]